MESIKTVSIIIPIYNTGDRLVRCLDSVMAQTMTDFECLMVDDGSTDRSPAIIDEYAARDPRFMAVHKPNGGVSSARNEGLKRACGEWVAFLDSDDELKPCHLEKMIGAADDSTDIVMTGFEQIKNNEVVHSHAYESHIYKGKEGIAQFLSDTDVLNYMVPWDRMYRRSVMVQNDVKFDTNLSLSEDRLFCYSYLLFTRGVATIAEKTYIHDASDETSLSFRFYPFEVNAYKHDVFVDATGKLLAGYPFSDHAVFLLWKYTWDLMLLSLTSLFDIRKNIFKVSRRQCEFFQNHFGWKLYDQVKDTLEVSRFSRNATFQMALQGKFLRWNFGKTIDYIKYKLHISR